MHSTSSAKATDVCELSLRVSVLFPYMYIVDIQTQRAYIYVYCFCIPASASMCDNVSAAVCHGVGGVLEVGAPDSGQDILKLSP